MDRHLGLINNSSFEMIASQIQAYTTKILVVKDGCSLQVLDSSNQISSYLKLELIKPNHIVKTEEFHYRDTQTDELWVFFHPDLHAWLQEGREGVFRLEVVGVGPRQEFETVTRVEEDFEVIQKVKPLPYQEPEEDSLDEDLSGLSINVADSDNLSPIDELVISRSYADTSHSTYI